MPKIAILCPYPFGGAPSQRFRYEQYLNFLADNNCTYQIFPFLDDETNAILIKNGHYWPKIKGVLKGFLRRFSLLFQLKKFDYIFIHREASLAGPPIFEWLIARVLKKKYILDFDDAIWLNKNVMANKWMGWIRNAEKTGKLCQWAYKVSCGNHFLGQYAQKFNPNVLYLPTTIDTQNHHNKTKIHTTKKNIVIGWTGTITTMLYLDMIYPILATLAEKYPLELHIISNKKPDVDYNFIRYVSWNKASEMEDLIQFDIGLMPLENTDWECGKCGFKALQYMALGIPAVVSPVGVNEQIIEDGENGFIAHNNKEWLEKLDLLISDVALRKRLGMAGQQTVIKRYSVLSQQQSYLALFS